MKVLRTILIIFLETVTIPFKLLLCLYALVRMIYLRITGILTFRDSWEVFVDGLKKGIRLNKHFINTGSFY